jgi:hypothetical protein
MNVRDILTIIEKVTIPSTMAFPNEFGSHVFTAADGWKVTVYYDAGDADFIESVTSPSGEVTEIYGNAALADDPLWTELTNRP